MGTRGRAFTNEEIQRIVTLLSETEMTVLEIAARMGCSHSAVIAINRKWRVRTYSGYKSKWRTLMSEKQSEENKGGEQTAA